MVSFIEMPGVNLMFNPSFSPAQWMWSKFPVDGLQQLLDREEAGRRFLYEHHLHPWLTDIICEVALEQVMASSGEFSEVRVHIHKHDDAHYSVSYENQEEDLQSPYAHLGNHQAKDPTEIHMGEPIFINPCSFDALAVILRDIGRQAGIRRYGGTREWLAIMCDGLPYTLGLQLIERFVRCNVCGQHFDGIDDATTLAMKKHPTSDKVSFSKEFDWVLLQPGSGHIVMNMVKGFVKLMWDVYWEDLVEVFNFRTENDKKSARNVSDHHKGWTLSRIAREAVARELVVQYVRHELTSSSEPHDFSAAGFIKFCLSSVENPNYAFLFNTHLELLDSIFAYRAGLRNGFSALVDAAQASFAKLWSATHHPMYRLLDTYNAVVNLCMPEQLQDQMKEYCSFNTSGIPFTGEGGDFQAWGADKAVQHWMPSVPTEDDWKAACQNYSRLKKLRKRTFEQMGIKDSKSKAVRIPSDISTQVMAFRTVIRQRGYLAEPTKKVPHVSLSGNPLDAELVSFCSKASYKQQKFMSSLVNNHQNLLYKRQIPFDETPVFITPGERAQYEHISNKTVPKIQEEIDAQIGLIGSVEMQSEFEAEFKKIKQNRRALKQDFITFHELVTEYVELQVSLDNLPDEEFISSE